MTDEMLEKTLRNWAAYVRDRKSRQQHCASIEHRYRSPQHWHPPGPRPPEIDWKEALIVEKIVVWMALSRGTLKYKVLLVGHYVKRARPEILCRKARIRMSDYDATLQVARLIVRNRMRET